MDALGVIPARHRSSRFPGKPLVEILGVPMVVRVARIAGIALGTESVVVATDDDRIAEVCAAHGIGVEMTSDDALTGTDRVAEVAQRRGADIYVNIQGDEPMLDPADIVRVVNAKRDRPDSVVNAMCALAEDEDPESINIPKVVTNEDGLLLYSSRRSIPGQKASDGAPPVIWKQVCIYAYNRDELLAFAKFGRKSALEALEDIEILRFFELGIPIAMVEAAGDTYAVDVPGDVAVVTAAMQQRGLA